MKFFNWLAFWLLKIMIYLSELRLFRSKREPNRLVRKPKLHLIQNKSPRVKKNLDPYGKRYYNRKNSNGAVNKGKENA